VLINLIGNSLKFTFKGSIIVSAIVYSEFDNNFLQIMVCDTGIGIKDEDRTKIFQMFGKLEATAKINTTGVGLGLSICKKIVEGLDGQIYLAEKCNSEHCI
jgi:two-component system, sensor histidine kinase